MGHGIKQKQNSLVAAVVIVDSVYCLFPQTGLGNAEMFGFFKKMMAGSAASAPTESMEYKGFQITACPIPESGHNFRVCGIISKDGQEKKFIRSDLIPDPKMACDIALDKARVIIDQQGDKIFTLNHI